MNDLFEAYIAALMRKALGPEGYEVISQGGLRYCLGDWQDEGECRGTLFQTRPDIIVRKNGAITHVVDTKWKMLSANIQDRKRGVAQADVYQMMAYSQLYQCERLMLLYPHHAQLGERRVIGRHGVAVPGGGRLDVATVALSGSRQAVEAQLAELIRASATGPQSIVGGQQTAQVALNV